MNDQRDCAENYRLFILGGAKSGKSRYAERVAESCPSPLIYVATAEAGDEEMERKIKNHRVRRSEVWTTIEEPLDLVGVLRSGSETRQTILVDCLTLWVSNLIIK
ncbi:MAG: bifunctional adenosylcobinamide kinase/adenosylcobinamide-phosphate guanylyltransferase, partial [Desulfobulbia bacterium]